RAAIIQRWWEQLLEVPGDRALLQRASSAAEAALALPTLTLIRRLGLTRDDRRFAVRCLLSRVVAWIRVDSSVRLLRELGYPSFPGERGKDEDRPRLAEVRFGRLLRVDDVNELAEHLIRLLRLAGSSTNVSKLGLDFLEWAQEGR